MFSDILKIVSASKSFFLPFVFFVVLCAALLLLTGKEELHIAINSYHHPASDFFFKYITHLGDGRLSLAAVMVLLFVKFRYALIMFIANFSASLSAQALKIFVFDDSLRPKKYFENLYQLHFVPDVDVHSYYSMPSGHTTTAFCVFACLTLIVKIKNYGGLFFLIALLTAFSRVYLSQHFMEDIFYGSLLGVFFALLVFYFFEKNVTSPKLEKRIPLFN